MKDVAAEMVRENQPANQSKGSPTTSSDSNGLLRPVCVTITPVSPLHCTVILVILLLLSNGRSALYPRPGPFIKIIRFHDLLLKRQSQSNMVGFTYIVKNKGGKQEEHHVGHRKMP